MPVEIVIDVLVAVASQKCLQEEFMIILFRDVLTTPLTNSLYWLFFLLGLCVLLVSVKIHFAQMLFIQTRLSMLNIKWGVLFLRFHRVSTVLKDMFLQFFVLHLISVLLAVLAQKGSKYIWFDLILVLMSQEIPVVNLLMVAIKIYEQQREQSVVSQQSFHYLILRLQILNC